jgi:hypothetical protein
MEDQQTVQLLRPLQAAEEAKAAFLPSTGAKQGQASESGRRREQRRKRGTSRLGDGFRETFSRHNS